MCEESAVSIPLAGALACIRTIQREQVDQVAVHLNTPLVAVRDVTLLASKLASRTELGWAGTPGRVNMIDKWDLPTCADTLTLDIPFTIGVARDQDFSRVGVGADHATRVTNDSRVACLTHILGVGGDTVELWDGWTLDKLTLSCDVVLSSEWVALHRDRTGLVWVHTLEVHLVVVLQGTA